MEPAKPSSVLPASSTIFPNPVHTFGRVADYFVEPHVRLDLAIGLPDLRHLVTPGRDLHPVASDLGCGGREGVLRTTQSTSCPHNVHTHHVKVDHEPQGIEDVALVGGPAQAAKLPNLEAILHQA